MSEEVISVKHPDQPFGWAVRNTEHVLNGGSRAYTDEEIIINHQFRELQALKAENDQMHEQIQRSYQKGCCLCKERIEELEGAIAYIKEHLEDWLPKAHKALLPWEKCVEVLEKGQQ